VARCGICQPRLWLDVAWRGLVPVDVGSPFGSSVSLAPLTFNNLVGDPNIATPPVMMALGAIDDRTCPMSSHAGLDGQRTKPRKTRRRSTSGGIAVPGRPRYGGDMTAQPASNPDPDEPYEVIHLGGETAAIVPLTELRRLQTVARRAPAELLEEAEIEATLAGHREWTAAGRPGAVSHEEAMAELLAGQ
jgi:hypothetical protein